MSKIRDLLVFVKQFLSETADQIVEAVENMISGGYKEEMFQSKRNISRRRKLLGGLLQPEIHGISEEAQLHLSVWDKDLLTEQQKWNSCEDAVKHFLTVAANRIVEAVEKMISHYKREMHQSKREISRQNKMLNALLQPEISLTKIPDEICQVDEPLPSAEQRPIETDEEVPSPGFFEHENEDDDDWNAIQNGDGDRNEAFQDAHSDGSDGDRNEAFQDAHSDGSEDWLLSQHRTRTGNIKSRICKVCGKSFQLEGPFLKHLKTHREKDCGLCGMHFKTEEDFELHLNAHEDEFAIRKNAKAVCDVCGKCFASLHLLNFHMKSHTGERPFVCEVCGKSFQTPHILKSHLTSHSEEKPFTCELCDTSFNTQGKLTRHHLIHTGEKPYACTICSELFIRYSTLRKHMRTHLKGKQITVTSTTPVYDDGNVHAEVITKQQLVQIICKVCGEDFHSKVLLVNHLESHSKDVCGLCGMHFNTEEEFECHLKTHKNEIAKVCDICGKCFAKPFYLEKHMRSHTGEKPFKCNVCDKPFRQRYQLMDHSRIHTGEKPYSCATCSKCFKTKPNLNQHTKRCRMN